MILFLWQATNTRLFSLQLGNPSVVLVRAPVVYKWFIDKDGGQQKVQTTTKSVSISEKELPRDSDPLHSFIG